jgi:hypothetical protein
MLNSNLIKGIYDILVSRFFLQNAYLHLTIHPCSAECSLGDAGTYNSVSVPKHLAMKT